MHAIVHDTYGPIEALRLREVEPPAIGERDVRVRVRAAGLHIADVFAVEGSPFLVRLMTGLRRPKIGIPGFDVAGVVEAVGAQVTRWQVGDEVVGAVAGGTTSELVRAREDDLVAKPAALTFPEAAALPTSGLAALHGLRAGRLAAGQRVLINGASGGVGHYAVQLAKAQGAHVTGVASTRSLEHLRALGADEVVDHTREDVTQRRGAFDLILDNVENHPLAAMRRALTPAGTLVLNSGSGASGVGMLVRLVRPVILDPFTRQHLRRYLSTPKPQDLQELVDLAAAGTVRPTIDRCFPLAETVAALRHVKDGHPRGKVVVVVA